MIQLPTEKKWSGDGWGADPRLMFQVKRSEKNAIYRVTSLKEGTTTCYEVFKIRISPKGTQIFDKVTEDDEEKYPTAEQFGRIAWAVNTQERAEEIFDMLEQGINPDAPEEVEEVKEKKIPPLPKNFDPQTIQFPVGPFTKKELAEHNKVVYGTAHAFVENFLNQRVIFVGKKAKGEKQKGKIAALYEKIS
jgi:hypothetical protein